MAQIITPEIRIKHKIHYMTAHIVNSIILFIQDHSEQEFYDRTGFVDEDLLAMVNYNYDFNLKELAKLSTALGLGIRVVGEYDKDKYNEQEEE